MPACLKRLAFAVNIILITTIVKNNVVLLDGQFSPLQAYKNRGKRIWYRNLTKLWSRAGVDLLVDAQWVPRLQKRETQGLIIILIKGRLLRLRMRRKHQQMAKAVSAKLMTNSLIWYYRCFCGSLGTSCCYLTDVIDPWSSLLLGSQATRKRCLWIGKYRWSVNT